MYRTYLILNLILVVLLLRIKQALNENHNDAIN